MANQEDLLAQQKAQCPFCKIVKGEIPSFKVYEDGQILAIADINPASKGHILVLPKEHYPILQLMPQETFRHLFEKLKYIERAVKEGLPAIDTYAYIASGGVAGQQSPHLLIHIIPKEKNDTLFTLEGSGVVDESKLQKLAQSYFGAPADKKKLVAQLLETNTELQTLLVEKPFEFEQKVRADPKLTEIFQGIDIAKLSARLKEASQ